MKKTFVALAALAATGASFAQIALYGVLDGGYQVSKTSVVAAGVTTDTRADGFVSNGAIGNDRFGVKGSEDLGSGLKANFKLEATANTADGTSNGVQLFNRQSWVGLSGGFGEVRLGRSLTPLYIVTDDSDVFETTGVSTVNLGPNGSRASNAVFYTTPALGGFFANAMYGTLDTGASSGTPGNVSAKKLTNASLSLGYSAGPLSVALGLGVQDQDNTTANGAPVVTSKNDGQALGFTYDFGAAKLFANYIKGKTRSDTSLNSYTENSETNLGVSVPVGAVTLLAGVGRNSQTTVTTGAEDATKTGTGNDWALGAYYNLSKRTVAFVKTGVYDKFSFGGATSNSQETTASNIGIRHSF